MLILNIYLKNPKRCLQNLDEEDSTKMILDGMDIPNYDDPEKKNIIVKDAVYKCHQLKGHKTQVTLAYNKGKINDVERNLRNKQINNVQIVINQYINHYKNKAKTIQGSGQKRGGNVFYFNDPKQLLKNWRNNGW